MGSFLRVLLALFSAAVLAFSPLLGTGAQALPPQPVEQVQPRLAQAFSCAAVTEIPQDECRALVLLYEETNGEAWKVNTRWLQNNTPSTWYGVSVANGHVVALRLANNGLTGRMPTALEQLPRLSYVELDGNALQGSLPQRLARPSQALVERGGAREISEPVRAPAEPAVVEEIPLPKLHTLPVTQSQRAEEPARVVLHGAQEVNAPARAYTPPSAEMTAATQAQVKSFDCATVTDIPLAECQALVALYNSATGAGWTTSTNWLSSTTAGTWYGVAVSGGHVTGIQMVSNNLIGTIPTEIGNLTSLTYFNLPQNQLSGSIPHEIGNLPALYQLSLYSNQLSGSIPAEIGQCTSLWSITLGGNNLSGSIPSQIGNLTALVDFQIQYNQISGTLPAQMGSMSSLDSLFAEYNQISGSLPSELGNVTPLKNFWINNNQLSGAVPESFTALTNLCIPGGGDPFCYGLDLGYNRLSTTGLSTALDNFLAAKDPDWKDTQWIPWTSCADVTQIPVSECNALVALYNATGGANWVDHTGWLDSGKPGTWYGVTVSAGHVTALDFGYNSNNLVGYLPAELGNLPQLTVLRIRQNYAGLADTPIPSSLGNLTNLTELDLYYNRLNGSIPASLGNLVNLQSLILASNRLSGAIPPEIGGMSALQQLALYSNQLTGSLPAQIGQLTNLTSITLGGNSLSGALPAEIGNLTQLYNFQIQFNQFTSIPPEIGNLSNLLYFYAHYNQFTSLPSQLGNLSKLKYFEIDHNQLSGAVPESFTNLVNLCVPGMMNCNSSIYGLDLGYNRLTTTSLSPALDTFLAAKDPDWKDTQWTPWTSCAAVTQIPVSECNALLALYNATGGANWYYHTGWLESGNPATWYGVTVSGGHVTKINLNWNNLVGGLPSELGNLPQLQFLSLTGNYQMGGSIPASLGNLTNLVGLDLQIDQLTGSIPASLGNLTNLQELYLSNNQLSGSIPAELAGLTNLRYFDLGYNNLTLGSIPAWLMGMTSLRGLGLANCQLSGAIPSGLAALTNLGWLNLAANQLTGSLPAWLGSLTNLTSIYLNNNQLSGAIPTELGNLTNISWLNLSYNQLSGAVPESFTNLVNLYVNTQYNDYGLDLGFNRLSISGLSPALDTFLAAKDPDWKDTQWTPWTSCADVTQIPTSECNALVAFYNATGGPDWDDHTNWLESGTPGSWYGVTVSGGHVTGLSLGWNNNLVGSLPAELGDLGQLTTLGLYGNYNGLGGEIPSSLGNLTNLQSLYLDSNQLTGSIPASLGNLTNLQSLYLSGNGLTGSVPAELGNLTNLRYFNLSYNNLTLGSIPAWLLGLTNLRGLGLSNCQISGAIPTGLSGLTSLEWLELGSNQLSGAIPPELGNLTNLYSLYLSYNQLTGSIPPELGNLTNLEQLALYHNQLSGAVPESFTNLVNLYIDPGNYYGLDLGFNRLTTTGLSPALDAFLAAKDPDWKDTQWTPWTSCAGVTGIPASECDALTAFYNATGGPGWTDHSGWLENGTPATWFGVNVSGGHVIGLSIYRNNLVGSLPSELSNLPQLQYLDLYYNPDLTGAIPASLGSLAQLQELYLLRNGLTGSIPASLGNLTNLMWLHLGGNALTGSIPAELGNLPNLQTLYLYANQLSGTIPSGLGGLTSLEWLELGSNQLSGAIPPELGNLTNLYSLYLYNNQLTGSIPAELGNLTALQYLDLSHNQLNGAVPESFTNLVNLAVDTAYGWYGLDLGYNRLSVPATPQALADFLDIKDPDWYLTQAAGGTVTPSAPFDLYSLDGAIHLAFPSGSVSGSVTVTLVPRPYLTNLLPDNLGFVWRAFGVEVTAGKASAYTFAQPVTVTITYDQLAVDQQYDLWGQLFAVKEDTLKLYVWNGAAWVDALTTCASPGSYTRDTAANTISLPICQSGEFALMGEKQQSLIYLPSIVR